jgi:hypothetical protein
MHTGVVTPLTQRWKFMTTSKMGGFSPSKFLTCCHRATGPYAWGMSRFDSSGDFTIGADKFTWIVKHYAGEFTSNTNFRGISARVCLAEAKSRELVIDFDVQDYPLKRPASSQQFELRIIEYTQKAIEAGWRPDSRGKPFRISADKLPR